MRRKTAAIGLAGACIAVAGILLAVRRVREEADAEIAALHRARALHAMRANRLDHDLRTPIGTIAAAMELLDAARPADAALQAEARRVIDRQLCHMTELTESLREFARELGRQASTDWSAAPERVAGSTERRPGWDMR